MKRYAMAHLNNLRDLGGYPTADGRCTQYRRFLRSDAPVALIDTELAALREMGLTTVVDLRGDYEANVEHSALERAPGLNVVRFPLDEGIAWPNGEDDYGRCYLDMATSPQMPNVMRTLAAAPGMALYHCSAGKDRTGVVSALLLGLCGVDVPDIVADYQVSYTYLIDKIQQLHEDDPTLPAHLGRSRPEYMWDFQRLLHRRYGSAEALLLDIGLVPKELDRLRAKLMDT